MNRLIVASILLAATFGVAHAEDRAAAVAPVVAAESAADSGKAENVVISADVEKPRTVADTGCVRTSGTRIRRAPDANGCNGQPGAAYTRSDLEATGRADTAAALKALDTRL